MARVVRRGRREGTRGTHPGPRDGLGGLLPPFQLTAITGHLHNGDLLRAAARLGVGHGIREQGAPHRIPVAWTRGARAGYVSWRDPGTFVDATIQHHEGHLGALGHRGYTL